MTLSWLDPVVLVLVIPATAVVLVAFVTNYRVSSKVNSIASLLTLAAALMLVEIRPEPGLFVVVDELNVAFVVINALVGFTTSIFSGSYIGFEIESRHLTFAYVRFYHSMYQAMMLGMNLALVSNNIGLLWVGVELATLATVVMVGIYRTHAAIEAAWKYFILGSVGISLAFFGTTLVYVAAGPSIGTGLPAMAWTNIYAHAASFDSGLLNVAFVFLLLGYGTKVGLVPVHAWLPDAHAEGPTPISAVLSGLLLNVALYALLRFKMIMAANGEAMVPGLLMAIMGLSSLTFGALMLYRRRDIKRLFAYSSIEHMGIITFAFGMGGAILNFAGLLHMMLHSLTKSAIFFCVGHVAQIKGTQKLADIRGLSESHPRLAGALIVSVIAIAGLPPLGMFMTEFLIVTSTFARAPWMAVPLLLGLLLALGALVKHLQSIMFGAPVGGSAGARASMTPIWFHLALVLAAGVYLPSALVGWLQSIATLLG